ncbi:unnamed protein product [Brachionus calyciflorus]|uniref:Uncharacterized protein n=1 Tax=Brachionus calyciflorus TaxID=104777 RepID=A0A814Q015_9BILA|nr:unnamed protein product [Brachionus calyciflorus]
MKFSKAKIFQIFSIFLLECVASEEWFTRINKDVENNLNYDKTVSIDSFSKKSKLSCLQICLSFESSCQFFQFSINKRCTIYSALKKECFHGENDIYLRRKKLPRIHFVNGSFVERSQLLNSVSFNLSRNEINLIAPFVFANSNRTTTLDLSFNNLTLIYSKSFYGMINLKTLNLSCNQISQLESDVFKELPSLAILHLGYNSLRYLNGNIFDNLQLLKDINLEFNQIESIEKYTFKNLNKLERIYLNNNNLKSLEPYFQNLESFIYLDISFNQIWFVHNDTFKSLNKVKILKIYMNQITEINSEMFRGASGLERLFINSNKIQKIDENFTQNVANLIHLDISKNNLSLIAPDIFNNLARLENLKLDFCNIKEINLRAQNLSSLIELQIYTNPLGNLTYPLITSQNSSLETLAISYCQLNYIDLNVLRNFTYLKKLNIAGNFLTLSNDTFNGFKSLTTVYAKKDDVQRFTFLYPNITFIIS